MRVVVPYAVERPKTRLAPVLDADERRAFAAAMLRDVLAAIRASGREPELLATRAPDAAIADGVPVTVDDRPLTEAVNAALAESLPAESVAVVMSDLALATPESLRRLFAAPGDIAVAPGLGGGTNALVVHHPEFRVDYHGASFLDHLRVARSVGARVREVDSLRLGTDVDEPGDLAEVLIHADGAAREWLADAGFELDAANGRVEVRRI